MQNIVIASSLLGTVPFNHVVFPSLRAGPVHMSHCQGGLIGTEVGSGPVSLTLWGFMCRGNPVCFTVWKGLVFKKKTCNDKIIFSKWENLSLGNRIIVESFLSHKKIYIILNENNEYEIFKWPHSFGKDGRGRGSSVSCVTFMHEAQFQHL